MEIVIRIGNQSSRQAYVLNMLLHDFLEVVV